MIKPHGSDTLNPLYVSDDAERTALLREAERLPSLVVCSAAAANAVMLGSGYFNPLTGYMNVAEALSVAEMMTLPDELFWPVPILNVVKPQQITADIRRAKRIALRDPNVDGNPVLAVMEVAGIEDISDEEMTTLVENTFRTLDPKHPGVEAFTSVGNVALSGPIRVLNFSYFAADFLDTFRTAWQIRDEIATLGWERVVAFQTRNPMHRAHEELCKMAKEAVRADGILIHMLLGKLKEGDIPADVRDASIRKMVELYFPPDTVLITGYGFDMLYAGPREAVLHAVFRQNCGCTHLIVGRDHAGVGSYYGPFDAQAVFDDVPSDALEIEIFRADHTAWSKKLNEVVMMRDHPDHRPEDYLTLSGTKVREMLAAGQKLPEEFARPEVAAILAAYYQREARAK
ncbi:MAG: sulfate adenylyltransferase [Planctomycetota bacterium]